MRTFDITITIIIIIISSSSNIIIVILFLSLLLFFVDKRGPWIEILNVICARLYHLLNKAKTVECKQSQSEDWAAYQ